MIEDDDDRQLKGQIEKEQKEVKDHQRYEERKKAVERKTHSRLLW